MSAVLVRVPDGSENFFVGYYDHSPFKPGCESLMLVHVTSHPAWRHPTPKVPVRIHLFDWEKGVILEELGESFAWNWQQGARALWLDEDTVIFNVYDTETDRYRAQVVGIDGKTQGFLPIPAQEVDSAGRVYSLSYEALGRIRPDYGYRNRRVALRALAKCAIEQYGISTGTHRVLVRVDTLQEEAQRRHGGKVKLAKLNHVMASPDARHLIFLFRYFVHDRRVTDLYCVCIDRIDTRLLVGDGAVSHACWWDAETVLAIMNGSAGFGYYRINLSDASVEPVWQYADGHPSRLDGNHLLTDTYPDQYGLRRLVVRSMLDNTVTEIAAFPEPLVFQGETRCDLHPSSSPSGRWIQVDCAVGHRRTVAVLPNPLFAGETTD